MSERPSRERVVERIREEMNVKQRPLVVVAAGEDDHVWYYIVVLDSVHEGDTFLNERYFALSKDTPEDDTFRKNGINRRWGGDSEAMADNLALAYERAAILGESEASSPTPIVLDASENPDVYGEQ